MAAAAAIGDGALLPPLSRDRRAWGLALLAAVLAFVVFVPALGNEFLNWDDEPLLLNIDDWRGLGPAQLRWMFSTYHFGHYQPITWLTYGLDYVLWDMNPTGYHLTNNLFHAANTLLVYFVALILLRRALEGPGEVRSWPVHLGALLATLVFALHPLRVESVAWVTERRDLVSAFFGLLTVLAYLRAVAPDQVHYRRWMGLTLLVYIVSMLGKIGGAPLGFVLLVLDWYPLRRLGPGPRQWLSRRGVAVGAEKIPFLVIAIGFSVATLRLQQGEWLYTLDNHSLPARTAQAFYGLVFYAGKTVVPTGLLPLYELRPPLDPGEARFVLATVVVLAMAVLALVQWRRRPGIAAAGLCYAFMIGPLLGFFQNGPQLVADRYSYLSCLSWPILLAGGLVALVRRRGGPRLRAAVAGGSLVVVGTLGALTWRQCEVWRNSVTLWSHTVRHDPDSSFGNNNLGALLLADGQNERALPFVRRAAEVDPRNYRAWFNLWTTLDRLARDEELRQSYVAATQSPVFFLQAQGHFRLGDLAYNRKVYDEALARYGDALAALRSQPLQASDVRRFAARLNNQYGASLFALGRGAESEPYHRRAIELEPRLIEARLNLALQLFRDRRYDRALAEVQAALRINPDHAGALGLLEQISAEQP